MDSAPRILCVADLNVYSKGYARLRLMRALGAVAEGLSHTPIGGEDAGYVPLDLPGKVMFKLGLHPDRADVNRKLPPLCRSLRPDLVWIEKGTMIRPRTLRAVRAAAPAAAIAWYSEDDMMMAHNSSLYFRRALPLYDCVITTKRPNADPAEFPRLGARAVLVVDKAYDPAQHRPLPVSAAERAELGADVGFIGTYEEDRARLMAFLAANGVRVRVWGNGWEASPHRHPDLVVERRALVNTEADARYTKAIAATRVNLGFLRKMNRDTQTDRTMEIPACGGFMLAERSDDHLRLFREGVEAEFFASPGELLAKARHYLDPAHEDARRAIAEAGRRRCERSGYSEAARLPAMIERCLAAGRGERPSP